MKTWQILVLIAAVILIIGSIVFCNKLASRRVRYQTPKDLKFDIKDQIREETDSKQQSVIQDPLSQCIQNLSQICVPTISREMLQSVNMENSQQVGNTQVELTEI
ncbi:Hypothetical_protein [Hexamita inflata]|uniref:Hypothetical_protein n=1 Tax=Hexamita inflata TaxID=28002 RepID=A0AA86UJB2_9EUKA|nr:Hypothetical protein HINF_LOCUS29808 [Hexamita inflata]